MRGAGLRYGRTIASSGADLNRAAEWFEKGIAQRDTRMPWITAGFHSDLLTSSPHWDRLARLMNLRTPPS